MRVKEIQEPIVKATIIVPEGVETVLSFIISNLNVSNLLEYFGEMLDLCYVRRGDDLDHKYLDSGSASSSRIMLTCTLPLSEIVSDFFDQLKSRSSGFASFEYVVIVVTMNIFIFTFCQL